MFKYASKFLPFVLCSLFFVSAVSATEYSSDNYKVLDPVLNETGGISTSTSYQLIGTIGEITPGLSTSTSYTVNAGSLAYAEASAPVLTATAGSEQVVLTWTASVGSLGWTVSGYDVCTGTVTNTYTCEDAGNVLTFTDTNLTAGTAYFFRVRAKDAFDNVIVRSSEATATPTEATAGPQEPPPSDPPPPPPSAVRNVTMSGRAYSGATVSLLQGGSVVRTVVASQQGNFSGTISAVASGTHNFGARAQDAQGRSSILLTYTANIPTTSVEWPIENIFIPPTIEISPAALTQGGTLAISGIAFPASAVTFDLDSVALAGSRTADGQGVWSHALDTSELSAGAHILRAKAGVGADESDFGAPQSFTIAVVPVVEPVSQCRGANVSLDDDGHIDSADVSILLTFWDQTEFTNQCADINSDGIVNLVDFSILLFNWTG